MLIGAHYKSRVMTQNLYLLPGTQCDDRLWEPLTAILPETIRLHPLSIPMNLNFEGIAQHLCGELPEHPVNLLGFSLGGYTAADFIVDSPLRVFILTSITEMLVSGNRLLQRTGLISKSFSVLLFA